MDRGPLHDERQRSRRQCAFQDLPGSDGDPNLLAYIVGGWVGGRWHILEVGNVYPERLA
jgi:hypothetical protein